MTQQPYAQPGYPPQQPFQPQYVEQQYAPQAYPQQPQAYYPPVQQAPQAPALANGSIDEFYAQPSIGGGPGISWKGKPDGYTVQGTVSRDVTNGDVTQEVGAPNTAEAGKPQFYRDGRPKFVMSIPLSVPVSQEFPEGEAKLYIRGQLRDELSRAMAEAQAGTTPQGGATITVTLVQRKQGRGAIPQNIFGVVYTLPGQQAPQIQAPVAQIQQQYAQPMQPQYQQAPQGYAQPPVQQYAPQPAPAQQPQYAPQPVQQYAPQPVAEAPSPAAAPAPQVQQPVQAPPVQQQVQAPQGVPQGVPAQQVAPQPPAGLSPEQQNILGQLQAG